MINKLFTLLTKKARFFNGEDPSPEKLNGIQIQNESAFDKIERTLGNCSDYGASGSDKRNATHNISEAIGKSSNIYKPISKVFSMSNVKDAFTNLGLKCIKVPAGETKALAIPIEIGQVVVIYYTSSSSFSFLTGNDHVTGDISPLSEGDNPVRSIIARVKRTITANSDTVNIIAGSSDLFIYALGIVASRPENLSELIYPSNQMFSIPFEQKLCTLKSTCIKSDECQDRLADGYCIGNSYEYDALSESFGLPKCVSANGPYEASSLNPYFVVQTPLLTVDLPYTIKYAPIIPYDVSPPNTSEIPENKIVLYDSFMRTNPILYNTTLNRASAVNANLFWISADAGIAEDATGSRYNLVGGDYGLSDMIVDFMKIYNGFV